ncbi:hypothetical protein [Microbulbifer sp. ARAS458-1]|uniref:hypothetical protein n=1 Tax=Microbulbifer sp. ARAS458-1 TaxID=3140242 RepID=UPI003877CF35
MYIEFVPTRLVTGGNGKLHADLQQYDVDDKPEGKEHTALSGFRETTAYRLERLSICRTVPLKLSDAELAAWREFAASCAFGEYFTFDALGTEAAPDDPQTVQLKFKSFKEKRLPGRFFEFSFTTLQVVA